MAAKTLEKLSKTELYERAQEADVPGRSDMSKDELVDALSAGKKKARDGSKSTQPSTAKRSSILNRCGDV